MSDETLPAPPLDPPDDGLTPCDGCGRRLTPAHLCWSHENAGEFCFNCRDILDRRRPVLQALATLAANALDGGEVDLVADEREPLKTREQIAEAFRSQIESMKDACDILVEAKKALT